MKSRVPFSSQLRTAGSEPRREVSPDVAHLLIAGRSELPAADLAQRIREAVSYRQVLTEARPVGLPRARRRRWFGWPTLAGSVAMAAGALLWWQAATRKHLPSIAPELASTATIEGAPNSRTAAIRRQPAEARGGAAERPPLSSARPLTGIVTASPCPQNATGAGKQPLIDDFEDGDDEVLRIESRSGLWRWARDTDAPGSAPALLPIPRANASAANRMAMHVKGGRLLDWGAIVEFNFKPACYDASVYGGLRFQARGPGRVFISPREIGTIPTAEGGTCTSDCYNPHVKKIQLDRHWRTYQIEWREFEQRGYGRPAFDPHRIHSLAFLIRPEDTPYDVWFDDVSFITR